MTVPLPPNKINQLFEESKKTNNFDELFYEWYRCVGMFAQFICLLDPKSPAFKEYKKFESAVFIGLLNRSVRLMLSNMKLSENGMFGETTIIIDRCILESCVKLIWLCKDDTTNKIKQFMTQGLKTELQLKKDIKSNIDINNGKIFPIEQRMLKSIENYIKRSELTDEEINSAKKMPNFNSILDDIGGSQIGYTVLMKVGSHGIHGTWPNLLKYFIKLDNDGVRPRDLGDVTHLNQYMIVCVYILNACKAYIQYIIEDGELKKALCDIISINYLNVIAEQYAYIAQEDYKL